MNILRLFIDPTYYQNRIYCTCVCHDEYYYEMGGVPCDGCLGYDGRNMALTSESEKRQCEVVRKLNTQYAVPSEHGMLSTWVSGGKQRTLRTNGLSATRAAL